MSSSVLQGVLPTTSALLGWLPWGGTSYPAPLEVADYSDKRAAEGPISGGRLKDVQARFHLSVLETA